MTNPFAYLNFSQQLYIMHKVLPIINASSLEQAQHYALTTERPEDDFALHVKEIMRLYKMGTKQDRALAHSKTQELRTHTRLIFKYKNLGKKELKIRKNLVSCSATKKKNNKIDEVSVTLFLPHFFQSKRF